MDLPAIMGNPLFSVYSLTAVINRIPFIPGLIGRMDLFSPRPLTTTLVLIEQQHNRLALVPEQPRGAPANRNVMGERGVIPFVVPHFPLSDTVMADSILGVRAFGTENQLEGIVEVINARLASMNTKHDVTLEHLRLGALRGEVITAVNRETGAVERSLDLYQHFGIPRPPVIDWPVINAPDAHLSELAWHAPIRGLITEMRRRLSDVLGGIPVTSMLCLCGSTFFDAIAGAPELRQIVLATVASETLRDPIFGARIPYAGVVFVELMGRVGARQFIEPDIGHFVPLGIPDLFIEAYAPAPYLETVNTLALRRYAKQRTLDFDKGVEVETQQNVLPLCTMPDVLFTARAVTARTTAARTAKERQAA